MNIIPDFPEYLATEDGNIFSVRTNKYLKPSRSNNNKKGSKDRLKVTLRDYRGRYVSRYVHRLVISAFKGLSDLDVNHIDGNPLNNDIDNLEYVTKSQNMKHAYMTKLTNGSSKGIIVEGKVFTSYSDASKYIGCSVSTITHAIKVGNYECKGFSFRLL